MDVDSVFELWNDYNWDWKSPADVKKFVDDAVETDCYGYSLGAFGVFSEDVTAEDWYFNYWSPVHGAIKEISQKFSETDLKQSVDILMKPFPDYDEGDPAIYDALLEYIPGFPQAWGEYADTLETYVRDWSEFAWYCPIGREFTWTYFSAETVAKSPQISSEFLQAMFDETWIDGAYSHPNRSLRIRLALATNPSTPQAILHFLFTHRNTADWLLQDKEEVGLLISQDNKYLINETAVGIAALREEAEETRKFRAVTGEMWYDCAQPEYIDHLIGIDYEASDASQALAMCLAMNPAITEEMCDGLSSMESEPVTYLLSKNPGIPTTLKARYALENPTFTFQPVMSTYADEETLS
jgi:hypothetical protein